jgi:septal ring factor EnvC (AmiA/AmiB activator)
VEGAELKFGIAARRMIVLGALTGTVFCCADLSPVLAASNLDQITLIRKRVLNLEQELVDGLHSARRARANMKKIQALLKLQKEERALGERRMAQLESTVKELEERKITLDARILEQRSEIRKSLIAVEKSIHTNTLQSPEQERLDAPRRKVLANLVDRGVKEVEALRIDLADAEQLESRIADEKQQLTYLFSDLDEQKGILELSISSYKQIS